MKRPARTHLKAQKAIATILLLSTTLTLASPPIDYAAAGRDQGSRDSTGEAKRLGRLTGLEDGKQMGYNEGFGVCAMEMRQSAIRRGERQGDIDGGAHGRDEGIARGTADGQNKGDTDGAADGNLRADHQAYTDATPRGTQDGINTANQTDAAARGSADGKIAGDAEARKTADASEYQPAREEYRAERTAEAIRSESTIRIGPSAEAPALRSAVSAGFSSTTMTDRSGSEDHHSNGNANHPANNPNDPPVPNVKPTQAAEQTLAYCKKNTSSTPAPIPSGTPLPSPSGTPSSKSEFEKCTDDYKPAYEVAFLATFKSEYIATYKIAYDQQFPQWKVEGCRAARADDYRTEYEAGYRRAYDESYQVVFNRLYNDTYGRVYRDSFAASSAESYDATYPAHYDTHYQAAKSKAIAERTGELYQRAYAAGKDSEYRAKYPVYAAATIKRARADEAAEFIRLPVRLLGLRVIESVRDGIMEPGEKLTVDMDLRNFSEATISARDLEIRATAKTASGVAIPGSVALLPRDLAAKSLNHILGALDIRLDESAIGRAASLEIQVSVKGQRLATESLSLTAARLTRIQLVETPVVRLGYPGALKLRVTNLSSLPLPENATVSVSTNMEGVTFEKTSGAVNALGAGEARDIQFGFTADGYTGGSPVLFTSSLNLASGRRVGLLNETREVPALQDYSFKVKNGLLTGSISDLKKSGKTKLVIFVKNISQRKGTGSLTATASITGVNASKFSFVKGNQVVFSPLDPGSEQKQKIVVRADGKNSGGTFVLEIRESGKLIGKYKENF